MHVICRSLANGSRGTAQRDEVVFRVLTRVAAELLVVNFEL